MRYAERVLDSEDVVGASPFIYGQGMIVSESNVIGAVIRGIDSETAGTVTNIEEAIGRGVVGRDEKVKSVGLSNIGKELIKKLEIDTASGKPPIIIGKELASTIGVTMGDIVNLLSPLGKLGPFGPQPKVKKFEVIGIFDYGMLEYDSSIAYISLNDAMNFFDMKDQVSGIEVKVQDIYEAREIGDRLTVILGFPYFIRSWEEVNRSPLSRSQVREISDCNLSCIHNTRCRIGYCEHTDYGSHGKGEGYRNTSRYGCNTWWHNEYFHNRWNDHWLYRNSAGYDSWVRHLLSFKNQRVY